MEAYMMLNEQEEQLNFLRRKKEELASMIDSTKKDDRSKKNNVEKSTEKASKLRKAIWNLEEFHYNLYDLRYRDAANIRLYFDLLDKGTGLHYHEIGPQSYILKKENRYLVRPMLTTPVRIKASETEKVRDGQKKSITVSKNIQESIHQQVIRIDSKSGSIQRDRDVTKKKAAAASNNAVADSIYDLIEKEILTSGLDDDEMNRELDKLRREKMKILLMSA